MLHKTTAVKFAVVFLFSSRLLHEGFSKRPKPDPTRTEQDSSKTKPLDKKIKPTNRNFSIKSLHSAFFPFLFMSFISRNYRSDRAPHYKKPTLSLPVRRYWLHVPYLPQAGSSVLRAHNE